MPRAALMSWEGAPAYRWVKMYKGVRYRVSCQELNAMVWTKEGSSRLANAWWGRKLAELNAAQTRAEYVAQVLAGEDDLSREARRLGERSSRREAALRQVFAKAGEPEPDAMLYEVREALSEAGGPLSRDVIKARVERGMGFPTTAEVANVIWEAIKQTRPDLIAAINAIPEADDLPALSSTTPAESSDRTIKALADRWSHNLAEEAARGARSADGADNARIALSHFVTFAGGRTDVGAINFDLWRRWYVHCRGEVARRDGDPRGKDGWSADYAKKVFGTSRSFVRWLYECEVIPALPRNLASKAHRFDAEVKAPPTFSNEEIRLLLDNATGQHKLHLLLMLNCGMTQKDISDLRKDQIDLTAATITRKRSKTKAKKSTPRVCYPLWPATRALLGEHLSSHPALALVTKSGRPWVRKEMTGGKLKKADNVATLFQHLRRKVKLSGEDKSLKMFRKTSATRLKSSKEYRDLRHFFLGHSDRNLADRHYAAESQALLAEAVTWLGGEYGLLSDPALGPAAQDAPRGR